jgi:hypothetical protein
MGVDSTPPKIVRFQLEINFGGGGRNDLQNLDSLRDNLWA